MPTGFTRLTSEPVITVSIYDAPEIGEPVATKPDATAFKSVGL